MRKLAIPLLALLALAIVAPAASAKWTDKGTALILGENPKVKLAGAFKWTSAALGTVECNNGTIEIELTGNTSEGHVRLFTADESVAQCTVTGVVGSVCGKNSLTKVSLGEITPVGLATVLNKTVLLNNLEVKFVFGTCMTIYMTDSGGVTATPNANPFSTFTLGGTMKAESKGNVTFSGTLGATPAATYGIE